MLSSKLKEKFGNKIRVRACGVLVEQEKILLINHKEIGKNGNIWLPPGGGIEFGDSIETTLIKEFKEETGLDITVARSLFTVEYIAPPLHSIEFFFEVKKRGGELGLGIDPELEEKEQILTEIGFYNEDQILNFGLDNLHHSFSCVESPLKILALKKHIVYEEI